MAKKLFGVLDNREFYLITLIVGFYAIFLFIRQLVFIGYAGYNFLGIGVLLLIGAYYFRSKAGVNKCKINNKDKYLTALAIGVMELINGLGAVWLGAMEGLLEGSYGIGYVFGALLIAFIILGIAWYFRSKIKEKNLRKLGTKGKYLVAVSVISMFLILFLLA